MQGRRLERRGASSLGVDHRSMRREALGRKATGQTGSEASGSKISALRGRALRGHRKDEEKARAEDMAGDIDEGDDMFCFMN